MLLLAKLHNGETLEFTVSSDHCVIGRSQQCDVVIPHEGMSRRHCLIEVKSGEVFVTDLQSMNGVFIEDQRIPPNVPTPYPVFLSLSFGVIQSLQIELNENKTEQTEVPRGTPPGASQSNPHSTGITRQMETPRASRTKQSSPSSGATKPTKEAPPVKTEDAAKKRQILLIVAAILGLLIVGYMEFTKEPEAPTPAEIYEN